jgi:asparagine N-glycosylation enzyme membrane subunit Stt3
MNILYYQGIVKLATIFIFCFVLLYSFFFLEHTKDKGKKNPWIYLVIACFLFLLYLIFSYFELFKLVAWQGIRELFEFTFGGLILLAFACQHYNLVVLRENIEKAKIVVQEKKKKL